MTESTKHTGQPHIIESTKHPCQPPIIENTKHTVQLHIESTEHTGQPHILESTKRTDQLHIIDNTHVSLISYAFINKSKFSVSLLDSFHSFEVPIAGAIVIFKHVKSLNIMRITIGACYEICAFTLG